MAGVALGYLVLYLWATLDLVVTGADLGRFAPIPSAELADAWWSKVLSQTGPFTYEPVLTVFASHHVQLLVSPVNIALGLSLGLLAGLNLALAVHVWRTARACRTRAFTGLLGAIPGLASGFTCCVPTVALAVGTQLAVALVALRDWLFPAALALLLLGVAWSVRQLRQLA